MNASIASLLKLKQSSNDKEFSFFEYLYSMNGGPEKALVYSKLFWPDMVEIDGYILIYENYDKEYFAQVLDQYGDANLEQTINTTYLYNLVGCNSEFDNGVWEALGNILCEAWEARAHNLFPEKRVTVEFNWYSESDDPGITMYQSCKKV